MQMKRTFQLQSRYELVAMFYFKMYCTVLRATARSDPLTTQGISSAHACNSMRALLLLADKLAFGDSSQDAGQEPHTPPAYNGAAD